jgi:hypothetical protein
VEQVSALRIFRPEFFINLPLRTPFYLDAVWGGPSCFAGNRRRFIKAGPHLGASAEVRVIVGDMETVWIRDRDVDPAKTVRVPKWKGK